MVGTMRTGITNAKDKIKTAWTISPSFRGWDLDRSHMAGSLRLAIALEYFSTNFRRWRRCR
jgi:hypothetical protein